MKNADEVWTLFGIGVGAIVMAVVVGRHMVRTYQRGQKKRRLQRRFADRLTRRSQ